MRMKLGILLATLAACGDSSKSTAVDAASIANLPDAGEDPDDPRRIGAGGGKGGTIVVPKDGGILGDGGQLPGGGSGGNGGLPPQPEGTCANPFILPSNVAHSDLLVNTSTKQHTLDLPCGGTGKEVVIAFEITQRELVYADTFGANWNTVLSFADKCNATPAPSAGESTMSCSNDACGSPQSQAIAVLGYGRHYLIVSGANGESGPVTVHFQHALLGNGPIAALPAGAGMIQGTSSGTGIVSRCEATAAENSYWWSTCPAYAGGAFTATTCNTGTTFDTILNVQIPKTETTSCGDDDPNCGVLSTLGATIPAGAGIHVMTLDGDTVNSVGAYTVKYTRP